MANSELNRSLNILIAYYCFNLIVNVTFVLFVHFHHTSINVIITVCTLGSATTDLNHVQ
jgi:hypothetical protein